jgi:hypothetical protein
MARYRIYYLRESQRQHFRQAPPAPGPLKLKLKDYEASGEIEAASPYTAWKQLQETPGELRPISVGDALETETGALLICRYAGFEEAQWFVPEAVSQPPVQETEPSPVRPH